MSISGGFRYRGTRIPALERRVPVRRLRQRRLWAATSNGAGTWTGQQHLLNSGGISSFGEDHAGELYITGYFNGTIYRLDPVDTDGDLLARLVGARVLRLDDRRQRRTPTRTATERRISPSTWPVPIR